MKSRSLPHEALAALLCLGLACASVPRARPQQAGATTSDEAERRWAPGPGAEAALEQLWAARAFEAAPSVLAIASKGTLPRAHETETLLFEEHETVEASGRSTITTHSVFRYLNDGADRTLTFRWAPWRERRPTIRARVISTEGDVSWLDPSSLVEGAPSVDGVTLGDVKALGVPLPNARLGSVVELQLTQVFDRPLLEGGGVLRSTGLWSFNPVRKMRLSAEVPEGPLALEVVGVPAPQIEHSGGTQRFRLEVDELAFKPMGLTRSQLAERAPRLSWSTGSSWEDVARRYRALIEEALAEKVELPGLAQLAAKATTPKDKVQGVLRWVNEHLRYTALHLGEGAIVPTGPRRVLERGWGDCKDLAVITAVALRSLGVEADVAAIAAGTPAPSERAAGLEAFNHMIVAAHDGAKLIWVDPTAPRYPAGVLPFDDREQRALVLSASTTGLTPTPRHEDALYALKQTFELELPDYELGRATVTLEATEAAEAALRSQLKSCDAAAAHALADDVMKNMFGDAPFTATVANCAPGSGPLLVTAKVERAPQLETLDLSADVGLFSRVADLVIPEGLHGDPPGQDQRNAQVKADQQRRLMEQWGVTEEEMEHRAFSLDSRARVERIYRIKLPQRFAPRALPPDRSLKVGFATLTETYQAVDASTVEVRFRFESDRLEYGPDDVQRFRADYWKRWSEPRPTLSFLYEPLKLLEDRKTDEVAALMRRYARESPKDGVTRARTAAMLLRLGLQELAKTEAERALEDAPNAAVPLVVRANVARCDSRGRLYAEPFERAKAIELFERASKLAPNHNWLVRSRADLLRRNEHGDLVKSVTADVRAATELLEQLSDAKQAGKEALDLLMEIYVTTRQVDALKALIAKRPELVEGDTSGSIDALRGGVDGALKRLARIEDPKERLSKLLVAYGTFAAVKRYDDARALLERFEAAPAIATEVQQLRTYATGVGPAPDVVDLSTPEAAAHTVIAVFANSVSDTDAAAKLEALASQAGRAELDGSRHGLVFARMPSREISALWDQLYFKAECQTSGSKALVRVRCQVPQNRTLSLTTYWAARGNKLELESLGKPSQIASRAWTLARAGRSADAAQWIDWLVDELQARENRGPSAALLKDHWAQGTSRSGEGLTLAAALSWFVYSDEIEQAPAAAVDALAKGRAQLSGALKRRADELLADVLATRHNWAAAAKALEPLATAENEPRLWRRLASLESRGGKAAKAMERTTAALKRDSQSSDWLELKGLIELRTGKYDRGFATFKKLAADKGDSIDVRNNLAWAQLMAGRLDEDAERSVLQMTSPKEAPEYTLHTGSMVLLERGRLLDAVALDSRRYVANAEGDEPSWLFRGRLLAALGYEDASRAALARVTSDPELKELKRRAPARLVARK
jgi:hypothetical protein